MWLKLFLLCIFVNFIFADEAKYCDVNKCKRPNCVCFGNIPSGQIPQFVILSFDDSVSSLISKRFYEPELYNRKNSDGCPISGTFFVPHEYTNYSVVHDLYAHGFEIGSHSVTKNYSTEYWKQASVELTKQEMGNQRKIISKFANIPINEIIGARIPHLQINGDKTMSGLQAAEFTYDNSWTTLAELPYFPYSLDYRSSQPCVIATCPVESHPGFWIVPINDWKGTDNQECNKLLGCNAKGTANEIFQWMMSNFNRYYLPGNKHHREPLNLVVNDAWFTYTDNSLEALRKFLDHLKTLKDVFVVSNKQIINWIKNPQPVGKYNSCQPKITPTSCAHLNCKLKNEFGEDRYMSSCVQCPSKYPTLKDPQV